MEVVGRWSVGAETRLIALPRCFAESWYLHTDTQKEGEQNRARVSAREIQRKTDNQRNLQRNTQITMAEMYI